MPHPSDTDNLYTGRQNSRFDCAVDDTSWNKPLIKGITVYLLANLSYIWFRTSAETGS